MGPENKHHIPTKWWRRKVSLQNAWACSTGILQLKPLTQTTPDISRLDPKGFRSFPPIPLRNRMG